MLRCVSNYKAGAIEFAPGDVIKDARLIAHLLNDSPLSFEVVEPEASKTIEFVLDGPETKDIEEPPVDKMIRKAARK